MQTLGRMEFLSRFNPEGVEQRSCSESYTLNISVSESQSPQGVCGRDPPSAVSCPERRKVGTSAIPPVPFMKTVVYSTLYGRYEPLQEIAIPGRDAADFILFTDAPGLRSCTWEVVHTGRLSSDPARDARRIKILTHEYLADHEISIYHDARIRLKPPPAAFLADFLPEPHSLFGCVKHPDRDCITRKPMSSPAAEWMIPRKFAARWHATGTRATRRTTGSSPAASWSGGTTTLRWSPP